jgi:hypothetical protein
METRSTGRYKARIQQVRRSTGTSCTARRCCMIRKDDMAHKSCMVRRNHMNRKDDMVHKGRIRNYQNCKTARRHQGS